MTPLNLVFLGAPGAGKGTQAQRLKDDFDLPYVATGDILREAVREGTPLGLEAKGFMDSGALVPDAVVIGLVGERLEQGDTEDGFVLDGFPRTIEQAEALGKELAKMGRTVTAVIFIDVGDEEVVRRLSGRRVCVKDGHSFHVDFDPPKHDDRCDIDGSRLIVRDDDKPDTVRNRLRTFREKTAPLVDYYEKAGVLKRVDGSQAPDEVQGRVRAVLATLRLEEKV